MCEAMKEAIARIHSNTDTLAAQIDALPIPCDFKAVFMAMAGDRGFKVNGATLEMMQAIGETESETCLLILEGNTKKAGLIAAYRLATELDNDKERATVVQYIRERKPNGVIDEKSVLLGILQVKGSRG